MTIELLNCFCLFTFSLCSNAKDRADKITMLVIDKCAMALVSTLYLKHIVKVCVEMREEPAAAWNINLMHIYLWN